MENAAKGTLNVWLPPLAYAVLIFVQSSYPSPRVLPHFFGADKILHFCGYGLMGLLLLRGFRLSNHQVARREILWSIGLTILYGISDEFHQHFVLTRTADVMDVLADALGGTCGVFLYGQLHRADFMARVKGKIL